MCKVSFRLLIRLFYSHILPILDYGSEIWYKGSGIKELEHVQLWFLKSSLGIKPQSSNLITYGETGRFPLLARQQDFVLKYWDRLRHFDTSKPLYKIYKELRILHNMGYKNWYSKVVGIFDDFDSVSINSEDAFLLNGQTVDSIYLHTKNLRYQDFINNFFECINDTEKRPLLRTYKTFKTIARCEPYLLAPLHYKQRQAISRIRASSHHLAIETGRHTKPQPIPLEKRTCKYCSSPQLDDEIHFILNCSSNIDERNFLFSKLPSHILSLSPRDLFIYLLNTNEEFHMKAFGKFLIDSFAARDPPNNGLVSYTQL